MTICEGGLRSREPGRMHRQFRGALLVTAVRVSSGERAAARLTWRIRGSSGSSSRGGSRWPAKAWLSSSRTRGARGRRLGRFPVSIHTAASACAALA